MLVKIDGSQRQGLKLTGRKIIRGNRWLDNILRDIQEMRIRRWRRMCEERNEYRWIVEKAKTAVCKTSKTKSSIMYVQTIHFMF